MSIREIRHHVDEIGSSLPHLEEEKSPSEKPMQIMTSKRVPVLVWLALLPALSLGAQATAPAPLPPAPLPPAQIPSASAPLQSAASAAAALPPTGTITLDEAIKRAQTSDTLFASAVADSKVAQAQRGIVRSLLLPGVVYHNQFIYTQPLRVPDPATLGVAPRFISNNSVHEYVSQGIVSETVAAAFFADYRRANADAAVATARLEVARRGLVVTVVNSYYGLLAATEKIEAFRRALDEARHFDTISAQLEAAGEVAHADVIKSHLQVQQRQRDLADAVLFAEKTRLDLAVLLFPDPLTPYAVAGDLQTLPALPLRSQVNASANTGNPDLKAALAYFRGASLELTSARFEYLPVLSLQYSYGIDASQFAFTARDGSRNLGYAAYATLDIPVWNWFATRDRIRQSAARKVLARVELTSTQRRLVASTQALYREAEVAQAQIASLETSVRDATEALRLSGLRYRSGEALILEVVDAQNTLITVQNSRTDAAARFYTALANLQTLTGNLP